MYENEKGAKIRGAFVQTKPIFGENELNSENAINLASKVKSDIYVFPELGNTGYAFRSKEESLTLSESIKSGKSIEIFRSFSQKNKCVVVAGIAEREKDKVYNSSVVIERGEVLGTYRKMHLFYRERFWFSPSDDGFKIFELKSLGCTIGVLICFDWIFPEAWRELALRGADIVCHPSNLVIPGKAQIGTMVRAIENRIFVITANRVGSENRGSKDKFKYTGRSQIISPLMEKLASANGTEAVARSAILHLSKARNKNVTSLNNIIEDRRVEFYTESVKKRRSRIIS
ncbi:MAG: nitrilase-related carbon-nitrogen hydrolase [Nitrososphaerales archaeon]